MTQTNKTRHILKACLLRVPLRRVSSIRTQLRAQGLLEEFLKENRPDMFNRRYAQCFPPGTPSLRLGRSSEKIYNFMDVSDCSGERTTQTKTEQRQGSGSIMLWGRFSSAGSKKLVDEAKSRTGGPESLLQQNKPNSIMLPLPCLNPRVKSSNLQM